MNNTIKLYTDEEIIINFLKGYLNKKRIINYFYIKYLQRFKKISFYTLKKFYNIPLTPDDLIFLAFDVIEQSISIYLKQNPNFDIKFVQLIIRKYKFSVLDYLKKQISNKNKILNNFISLEQNENYFSSLIKNNTDNFVNKIYENILIERIYSDFYQLNNFEKIILKFREIGYKNREISKILDIHSKKVDNILQKSKSKIIKKINN